MTATPEERLARVEDRMLWLQKRLERLEGRLDSAPESQPRPRPRPQPAAQTLSERPPLPPRKQPPPPRREVDLEELLGGRLLALVGGVAVLVGLAFLVAGGA